MVTKLFITGRKPDICLIFITESHFVVPKSIGANSTHFFIIKILNKWELQQIAINLSSDIDFRDFMNLYKKCTEKAYSVLVTDTTLASGNLFQKI